MIFAKRAVAGEEIAHRVVLALQRLRRRDAGDPAEFLFADDPDLAGLLSVEYFRSFELVRRAAGCRAVGFGRIGGVGRLRRRTEAFGADDEHRRLRVDVVGCGAAQTRHQGACVSAAEGAEFSREDNELSREWRTTRLVRRG